MTHTPYSSFWLKRFDFQKFRAMDHSSPAYLLALAAIRRGVENFVRIVAEKEIPVKYIVGDRVSAGGESIFDANKQVIEIAAPDDIDKVDAIVGRAIAEGVHMILSHQTNTEESIPVFASILHIFEHSTAYITPALEAEMARLRLEPDDFSEDLTRLMLVLEDRRCDAWMYDRAPGYRPYYQEMYHELWESQDVETALRLPETQTPTLLNYRFRLTTLGHPASQPTALPGLAAMAAVLDLPNVRRFAGNVRQWHTYVHNYGINVATGAKTYDDLMLPEMIRVARDVVLQMYQQCPTPPEPEPQPEPDEAPEQEPESNAPVPSDQGPENTEGTNGTDPNYDPFFSPPPPETSAVADAYQTAKDRYLAGLSPIERMIYGLQEKLDNDLYHETDRPGLDGDLAQEMQALDSGGTDLTEVGTGLHGPTGEPIKKIPCVVYRRLTDQLMQSNAFPFAYRRHDRNGRGAQVADHPLSAKALVDGTHMGNALAHRIQVLADESKLIITRQKKGKIDKRMLSGLGYDYDSVFCETLIERKEPIVLHFSVDASGSMGGPKWQKALTVAVALARCAKKIRTLDVTISLRSTDDTGNAAVALIFDSRRDSFEHVRHFFPQLCVAGGTPEGLAFEAIRDEILNFDPKARKFFVNISDGAPAFGYSEKDTDTYFSYSGETAWQHTALQMRDFRAAGITVLSYYIGGEYDDDGERTAFRTMYGREAEFIDVDKITQIARTLNKMFLREDG